MMSRTGIQDQVFQGQATDIALEVKNIKLWNSRMEAELVSLTGQKPEVISSNLKRDWYLSADEAVQFGVVDYVMLPAPRKRSESKQGTDLGAFEGTEEQRYQKNQKDSSGWGSRKAVDDQSQSKGGSDDDNEPKIAKG
jgi:Clp protease